MSTAVAERKASGPVYGSAADDHWGYKFGIDGLWELEEASKFLGNASRSTMDRLTTERKIRKGRHGSRVVFCVRSIRDHASTLEI